MKIKILLEDKTEKIVDLFEITYECSPDRFKSLRLSNGAFPDNVILDYKDQSVTIPKDFLAGSENEDIVDFLEHANQFLSLETGSVLTKNWFCYPKGHSLSDLMFFVQGLSRSRRN
ncbi:MAG: hypothetical protein CL760_07205 [Chloroflexi bacterium]|nr:hypothetical protein [Chloroflexota bacterium]|tara:strand:- start:27531 stop:27878 length:348 start_codon:yes stop_codon:yes gene_type:complete